MAIYREPADGSELLVFLGVVPFFNNLVPNCADPVAPLDDMLNGTGWNKEKPKNLRFHIPGWDLSGAPLAQGVNPRHEGYQGGATVASPTFLVPWMPDRNKQIIADASVIGYGAVLLQLEPNKIGRPFFFGTQEAQGTRDEIYMQGERSRKTDLLPEKSETMT